MGWVKKKLVITPSMFSWGKHSALQPTAFMPTSEIIRMYVGVRDAQGVGRIAAVDLSAKNPETVLKVYPDPMLDIGRKGMFDENGVIPSCIVKRKEGLFLYYAGYQLGNKVRFYVFTGLAISKDDGITFERYQPTPVTDRVGDESLFRVIHSMLYEKGCWRVWYGAGDHFIEGKNSSRPSYNVRYMESNDGMHFPLSEGSVVLETGEEEYRVGRPYVLKTSEEYLMHYGYSTLDEPYRLGFAVSSDGISWVRKDKEFSLDLTQEGFDSDMSAYPCIVSTKYGKYLFYNGNNYGYEGLGYAKWEEK